MSGIIEGATCRWEPAKKDRFNEHCVITFQKENKVEFWCKIDNIGTRNIATYEISKNGKLIFIEVIKKDVLPMYPGLVCRDKDTLYVRSASIIVIDQRKFFRVEQ